MCSSGSGHRAFRRLHFGEHQREQMRGFVEFELDGLARLQLLLDVLDERREVVAPRDHGELVAAEAFERNARFPDVEAGGLRGAHRHFVPGGFVGGAPDHGGGDLVVTFGEDRGADFGALADRALGREAAVVDRRHHAFDRHARRVRSLRARSCGRCVCCSPCRSAARGGSASPSPRGTGARRRAASVNGVKPAGAAWPGASSGTKRVKLPGAPARKRAGSTCTGAPSSGLMAIRIASAASRRSG